MLMSRYRDWLDARAPIMLAAAPGLQHLREINLLNLESVESCLVLERVQLVGNFMIQLQR